MSRSALDATWVDFFDPPHDIEIIERIMTRPGRSPEHRIVSTILFLKNLKGVF